MEHIEQGYFSHDSAITTIATTTTTGDIHHHQNCKDCKESAINNDQQDILPFSILPSELKAHILTYLPSNEIINFSSVSRSSYELIAPSLSDSIDVEENADEYSIDTWSEMVNRLKGFKIKQVETLQDCKKLFLKTLLEQRLCRSCKKGTPDFKTLLKGEIVKSCRCDGYICRKSCWEDERFADESIESCSKCGYGYQFTNTEKGGTIAKHISKYLIPYQLLLTAMTYFPYLLFLYIFIAALGDGAKEDIGSKVWLKLDGFWYFKYLPMWKGFLKGMPIISLITMGIVIITDMIVFLFGGGSIWGQGPVPELEAFEFLVLIGTILFVVVTPFILGSIFRKIFLMCAIYGCSIKAPQKKIL